MQSMIVDYNPDTKKEEWYQATEGNGGFPHLGFYRVFPKKNYHDLGGVLWELVARRTREFTFTMLAQTDKVVISGFENKGLDGLTLTVWEVDAGWMALKATLKDKGYPSCTALEMYTAWMQAEDIQFDTERVSRQA